MAGIVCALLPDMDVIGFRFGVSYADVLGHRGFTHSLLFAGISGCLAAIIAPLLKSGRAAAFIVCAGAVLSHILLDAMTNGGLGVALLWPWSEARFFFPWRPIKVSPFSLNSLFSRRGADIFRSELFWVWLPSLAGMIGIYSARAVGRICRRARTAQR